MLLTNTLLRVRVSADLLPADRLLWTVLAAIAAIVPAWEHLLSIEITGQTQAFCIVAVLLGLRAVYVTVRPGARIIHTVLENGASIIAYTAVMAPVTYLCARNSMPLFDDVFRMADAWMGYDWQAWADFEIGIPMLSIVLRLAYASLLPQTVIALVVLPIIGDGRRGFSFIRASLIAVIVACAGSYVMPAAMPAGVNTAWYSHWAALRSAVPFKISLSQVEGIITFPSFHASVAILILYSMRGLGAVTAVFGILELLMLVATTTYGFHYFTDVVGGIVVAVGAIWATSQLDRIFVFGGLRADCNPSGSTAGGD